MTGFPQIAAENGADVSTELTADDLSEGDKVVLFKDTDDFEHHTVAGFEQGMLNPIVVLDDGTQVEAHLLSDGNGQPKGGDLFAAIEE